MRKRSSLFYRIVAKTDPAAPDKFLPLWMHARDAAAVMQYLIDHWLAESILDAIGLNKNELYKLEFFYCHAARRRKSV